MNERADFPVLGLPFIDEHSRRIDAPVDVVWTAIGAVLPGGGGPLAAIAVGVLGLHPASAAGDPLQVGSTLPGFAVVGAEPSTRLVLAGRHRASRYAMILRLEPDGDATVVRVATRAVFPGRVGRAYRAAVIGSRGHVIAVRRLLAAIDRQARRST